MSERPDEEMARDETAPGEESEHDSIVGGVRSYAVGLVAAAIYTLAPFALRETLLYGGNYPQYLAISLYPWVLWALGRGAGERGRPWRWTRYRGTPGSGPRSAAHLRKTGSSPMPCGWRSPPRCGRFTPPRRPRPPRRR